VKFPRATRQKRKLIWQPKSGKRHLFGAHSPSRTGGIRGPVSGYGVHHPLTHAATKTDACET
jgi:hypothetical protein